LDEIQKTVLESVENFARGARQADDLTILVVRYRAWRRHHRSRRCRHQIGRSQRLSGKSLQERNYFTSRKLPEPALQVPLG